jgi:hypothetical protein
VTRSRRPLQFSLGSLLCLIVGLGSVLAAALPGGAYAPLIGWCILAVIYFRQGWNDLLFVHGVLPGISLSMLAILAVFATFSVTAGPWGPILDDLATMTYWLLFVSCLAGNIVSQAYYIYLLVILGVPKASD